MNKTIYRQYDSRWGKLPYPNKKVNLSNSGCGCLSVFHCAIENPKYAKLTVKQCQQFMVKYSRSGQGTDWSGIKAGLEHYGYNVHWKQSDGMKEIWAALKNSKKMGVILFHKGKAPNGTVWTTSGHYIAFTDYRIKDGRHEFYCKDSGPRKHDGWYSYERSMKGCIFFVYVCKSLKEAAKAPAKAPTTTTRTAQDKMCAWAKMIADSKKLKYVKYTDNKKTRTCPICTKRVTINAVYDASKNVYTLKSYKVNDKDANGGNCIWYAFHCWRHGAGLKSKCSCSVVHNAAWESILKAKTDAEATKIAQDRLGIKQVKAIRNGGKVIPTSSLKKGDIIAFFDGNTYKHTALYIGDGKMTDDSGGQTPNIKYGIPIRKTCKVVLRYTG